MLRINNEMRYFFLDMLSHLFGVFKFSHKSKDFSDACVLTMISIKMSEKLRQNFISRHVANRILFKTDVIFFCLLIMILHI